MINTLIRNFSFSNYLKRSDIKAIQRYIRIPLEVSLLLIYVKMGKNKKKAKEENNVCLLPNKNKYAQVSLYFK